MPSPLDYQPPQPRHLAWRLPLKMVAAIVIGLALLFSLLQFPVRQERIRMDAITGTIETQATWFGALTTSPQLKISPIEQRLTKIGTTWPRDWRVLNVIDRSLVGVVTCRACGSAPPIYAFHGAQEPFVRSASDDHVLALIRVLQTGTDDEQHVALSHAVDAAFNSPN